MERYLGFNYTCLNKYLLPNIHCIHAYIYRLFTERKIKERAIERLYCSVLTKSSLYWSESKIDDVMKITKLNQCKKKPFSNDWETTIWHTPKKMMEPFIIRAMVFFVLTAGYLNFSDGWMKVSFFETNIIKT